MYKTAIIFFKALRRLSYGKLFSLFGLGIRHPLFSVLSFYATLKTFSLTQKYFPDNHSGNGKGNAFRHALWSCLIMMYCCKVSSPQKTLLWCKKLTDLHEELFPNEPLEKQMDLHNNSVGMNLFMEILKGVHRQFFETSFFIDILLQKTEEAKILNSNEKISKTDLCYIDDFSELKM